MTAVEWLVNELKELKTPRTWNEIIKQAKEMEKQQIIEAYVVANGELIEHSIPRAEQYYNEKFNK